MSWPLPAKNLKSRLAASKSTSCSYPGNILVGQREHYVHGLLSVLGLCIFREPCRGSSCSEGGDYAEVSERVAVSFELLVDLWRGGCLMGPNVELVIILFWTESIVDFGEQFSKADHVLFRK